MKPNTLIRKVSNANSYQDTNQYWDLEDYHHHGNCKDCGDSLSRRGWCKSCNKNHRFNQDFEKWTSGNKDIDQFIQCSQLNVQERKDVVEWIPFENLILGEKIGEGGFGCVSKAYWKDGPIDESGWNTDLCDWNRESNLTVALKTVATIENLLKEVRVF